MAICMQQVGSSLEVVGDYTSSCVGFAVMTAQEYAATPTLASLFAVPDSAGIQQAFIAGFSLPLVLWLTAWAFGSVIEFVNSRTAVPSTLED